MIWPPRALIQINCRHRPGRYGTKRIGKSRYRFDPLFYLEGAVGVVERTDGQECDTQICQERGRAASKRGAGEGGAVEATGTLSQRTPMGWTQCEACRVLSVW